MRNILVILLMLMTAPLFSAFGEPPKEIRIVTPVWRGFTHEDGTGLYFDIIRRVYEPRGIAVKTDIVPWERAKAMIRTGKADAMPAAYLTPDDPTWTYPEQPMDMDETAVVFKAGEIDEWEGENSLEGKFIVWPRGYNFQNYMDADVQWLEIDVQDQAWAMLDNHRADVYMNILPEIEHYMKSHDVNPAAYCVETAFTINTYLRFGRNETADELIRIYDKEILKLYESGALHALFKKWDVRFPEAAFSGQ